MVKLISESITSKGFYSPIRLNYPNILVKRDNIIEIFRITSSPNLLKTIQYEESNTIYDYL